jgi:DNA replication factor GINS
MDIDELLIFLEKNRNKLIKIEDDFYEKINNRLSELEKSRLSAGDSEIARIDDNIRTIRRIQKKIFETRTSKIVRLAWSRVCGGTEDIESLNKGEKELYFNLVQILSEYRDSVFQNKKIEKENREIEPEESYINSDYIVVRVKSNLDEFEGVDGKTYKLSKEDVVTLPKLNAKALIKADAVEPIETREVNRE